MLRSAVVASALWTLLAAGTTTRVKQTPYRQAVLANNTTAATLQIGSKCDVNSDGSINSVDALVILLAHYAERHQRLLSTLGRGLAVPGTLICLTLGLIFLEPDWGTTLLLAAVSGLMLLIAGVRWRCFFPPLLAGAGHRR